MTKTQAIKKFGSVKAIARLLDITPEAVYQWPEQIPPLRVFQLRSHVWIDGKAKRNGSRN